MMKEITCIVCPRGCSLTVDEVKGEYTVSGNFCKRGKDFAVSEMTYPMRTICSTVYTVFPDTPVLPVRVSSDIPKNRITDVMNEINNTIIDERIGRGEIVIHNVCALGVDVIATSNILKEQP